MDEVQEHIKEILIKKRDEFICLLEEQGFTQRQIADIFSKEITSSRINQIIIRERAKKLTKEGE